MTWQPNNWYIVGTASYYKDYVPSTRQRTLSHFFAGDGYGLEGFVGYTFNIDKPFLKSIQPYVAADSLRLKGDEAYHANHVYLGAGTTIGYGLSVYVERTLANSSDNEPDSTGLRCSTTSDFTCSKPAPAPAFHMVIAPPRSLQRRCAPP
ncbi:hypothetical protein M8494_25055 [Serratia ureilytica]